jgi:hypothetical protein
MSKPKGPYTMHPPVLTVPIENSMDVMIARNTARRAAGLLGFNPAHQAQLASAAGTLAELVLKTGSTHTLHFNGVMSPDKRGIQLSVVTPWLAGASSSNVMIALRSKLGDLVDEILIENESSPTIMMMMWRDETNSQDVPENLDDTTN